jgi:hypothetical protein
MSLFIALQLHEEGGAIETMEKYSLAHLGVPPIHTGLRHRLGTLVVLLFCLIACLLGLCLVHCLWIVWSVVFGSLIAVCLFVMYPSVWLCFSSCHIP